MEQLLADDGAVPSRDRLLDIDEMRRHLPAMPGRRGEAIEALRIKYRPFESLRVVYRIDGRTILTARTFAPFELAAAARRGQADFTVPELGAAFWTFPATAGCAISSSSLIRIRRCARTSQGGWRAGSPATPRRNARSSRA